MNENYYLANVHQVTTQLQCLIVIIKVKFKNRICKMSDSVVQSTLFKYFAPYPEELSIYASKLYHFRIICRGEIKYSRQLSYLMFISSLDTLLWSIGKYRNITPSEINK